MNLKINGQISRENWAKALKAEKMSHETKAALDKSFDEAEKLLQSEAKPKAVCRLVKISEVPTPGFSIKKHLDGCHSVIVMAVTLGMGVDNLIRRLQLTDMALAVIADSGATVLIEQLCDDFQKEAAAQTDGYTTSRFSPGYGDFPVTVQGEIVRIADAGRKIGLNVTSGSLMIPRKSVTALIGVADHPVKGRLATCSECVLRGKCSLRKEGKYCGD